MTTTTYDAVADRQEQIEEALEREDAVALRHLAVSATDEEEHDQLITIARQIDDNYWAYDRSIGN